MPIDWDAWNQSADAERVVLVRLGYYDISESAVDTLNIASERYYDADNSIFYENNLVEVPTLSIGRRSVDPGASGIGIGDVVVSNINRRYMEHFEDSFIGRDVEILTGPRGFSIDNFNVVFAGVISQVSFEAAITINFQVRDSLEKLNVPVQTDRFPDELEANRIIPLCYGYVLAVPVILAHATAFIYQVCSDSVENVVVTMLEDGIDISSRVTVRNNSFGTLAVNQKPSGTQLANVYGIDEGTGTRIDSVGDVIKNILTRVHDSGDSILSLSDIDTAALAVMDASITERVSLYVGDEETALDTLDRLMPAGYLYGFNKSGMFYAALLDAPENQTATKTLSQSDIIIDEFRADQRLDPTWKVVDKRWPVNENPSSFASTASNAVIRRYSGDYYTSGSTDDVTIKTKFKGSRETVLESSRDASADYLRVFNLMSVRRNVYAIDCWAKPLGFDEGEIIEITYPDFDMQNGKNFVFLGSENQLNQSRVTAYFWG